jgi:hypothetical protein
MATDGAKSLSNDLASLKIGEDEQRANSASPSCPASGAGAGGGGGSFIASFKAFSKFGDTKSDGKLITLSQSDKWMKQAKVIDGKKITTTDTGIYFKKQKYVVLGAWRLPPFPLFSLLSFKNSQLALLKDSKGTAYDRFVKLQ